MSNLDLARLQFASTSIYHFLFVPVTIGLAVLVAILQTRWHKSGDPEEKRLIKFFGTLLLINVAVGVVTGLIQEFEFGMNWSVYSRYVGAVFGAPLAMEGLAAFFLESTFLGLWIFGWGRLPKRIHLACIWLVAAGAMLSAMFIMAANSWMQHPVGYTINQQTHVAELTNIWDLFTNPVFLWGYTHVILTSLVTGSVLMIGVSAWQLRRKVHPPELFRKTAMLATVVLLPAIALNLFVGSELGVQEGTYQPVKIAAAEALWTTCPSHCPFSLFQIEGGNNDETPTQIILVPDLLSILATNHLDGEVQGLNNLQAQYTSKYGPGNYIPNVFIQYWSMRVMAYLGSLVVLFALWAAWLLRQRKKRTSDPPGSSRGFKLFLWVAPWLIVLPFLINTAGWLLTENGRQPWIVQGLLLTKNGVSPSVSATDIWISLILFWGVFLALGATDLFLMVRYARKPLAESSEGGDGGDIDDDEHEGEVERADEFDLVY